MEMDELDIEKLKRIKTFFIDVDGTLTDGSYEVSETGLISKSFNTRDFYALHRMYNTGYDIVIITGADDQVIEKKCCGLPFEIITSSITKVKDIERYQKREKIKWEQTAFIGDAENDLEAMSRSYFSACPLDAIPEVTECVDYQSMIEGGRGAVYDIMRKYCKICSIDWFK